MREFTHSQSFHNNDGNLLHGRLKFFKLNTTELQPIYNSEGTVITNPIFTNTIGQTVQQVFLDDKDYTVQFEQYVGNGEMEEDTDETNWLYQYSCEDIYDTFNISIDSKGLQVINSISELRNTDPEYIAEHSGNKLIQLAGYYEAGDKPSILYKWDENNTSNDDGGATIKVDDISVGRWVFVENQTDTYDVRHWGAFPATSYTQISVEQSYSIQNANTYAAGISAKIYFPSTIIGAGYYHLQTSVSNAVFDTNTYIFIPSSYNINVSLADNSKNLNIGQTTNYFGNVKITGQYLHYNCLRTFGSGITKDYSKLQLVPLVRFDIDANIEYPISVSNVDIYVTGTPTSTSSNNILYVKNCNIHSVAAIQQNLYVNFEECTIRENYFAANNNLANCNFTNCSSLPSYWNTTSKYIAYCQKNGNSIIDFEGRPISENIVWSKDGDITFKNIGNTTAQLRFTGAGIKKFDNVIASNVNITESNNDVTLIVKDSNIKISPLANQRIKSVTVENSQLEMNRNTASVIWTEAITLFNSILISNSELRPSSIATTDSEIKCNLNLYGSTSSTFYSSVIRNKIDCYSIEIDDCDIYAPINMTNNPSSVYINFAITNNRFRTGGKHNLSATLVSGQKPRLQNSKWVNNISYVGMFIALDRTNLHVSETMHDYIYKDNTGDGVLSQDPTFTVNLAGVSIATDADYSSSYQCSYKGTSFNVSKFDNTTKTYSQNMDIYTCQFQMFTVGTNITSCKYALEAISDGSINLSSNFNIKAGVVQSLTTTGSTSADKSAVEIIQLAWNSGYDYRLYNIKYADTMNSASHTVSFRIIRIR